MDGVLQVVLFLLPDRLLYFGHVLSLQDKEQLVQNQVD